jgi:hypothetical protein
MEGLGALSPCVLVFHVIEWCTYFDVNTVLRIGWFLHILFPSYGFFDVLLHRRDILDGILGAWNERCRVDSAVGMDGWRLVSISCEGSIRQRKARIILTYI